MIVARQPTYRELFRVGDLVEVGQAPLDGEIHPQWLIGTVSKATTRLYVRHPGAGVSVYDRADYNRGVVRKAGLHRVSLGAPTAAGDSERRK